MNYQNLYDYTRDISQNLGVSVKWVHSDKSWLNLINPNESITCWCLPFSSSGSVGLNVPISRIWTIEIIFYQQDKSDSDLDQNDTSKQQDSIRVLANTDRVAETFLRLFSENNITRELSFASSLVSVNNYSTSTAIRDTAQQLTGTLLTISAEFPDRFNYCC